MISLVPAAARAWMVPQTLGETPGMQVACHRCRTVTWEPWRELPEYLLPRSGLVATNCPSCGAWIEAEVAPDWGEHLRPYPRWLRERLGMEDDPDDPATA